MIPRSPIKLALLVIPALTLGGIVLLLLLIVVPRSAPIPPQPLATWLPDNSETRVDFKGSTTTSTTRLYNFAAPTATRLKLDATTPGFAFAAEIRDAAGQTVAAFTDKLQSVQVTLAGDPGQYQIALSAADAQADGTVALRLGSAIIAPAALDGTALRANDCRVTNAADEVNALIRSAPADRYAVIGLLPPGASLPVIGRTDNDWYTVDFNERQAWITGAVVAPVGDCTGVPIVHNPAIPTAPVDPDALLVQVDRDGSTTYRDAISTPEGDTHDLIWVRAINLYTEPPNNFREFALTLNCRGEGAEHLRWGSAYQPDLHCGATLVLPFIVSSAQQPIVVQFAPDSPQSYAEYDLSIQPTTAEG